MRERATPRETILENPMLDFPVMTRKGVMIYAPIVNGFEKSRQVVTNDELVSTQTALAVDYMLMEGGAV